jgi:hypothetical protein
MRASCPCTFKFTFTPVRFSPRGVFLCDILMYMGFFSSSKRFKPTKKELRRALRGTRGLRRSQRNEIQDSLWEKRSGGLSGKEIKRVMRGFKQNPYDSIGKSEAKRAKRRLSGFFSGW